MSLGLYRECAGAKNLMSRRRLIAGAFPIRRLVGSRPTLAGRLLLWELVFRVPARFGDVAGVDRAVAFTPRCYRQVPSFAIALKTGSRAREPGNE
jgi:hypothetical protein